MSSDSDSEDDTVWSVYPPLIENIMEVYLGRDESKNLSFTITANVRYDLTCPLYEANPPIDITVKYTDVDSKNVEAKKRLNSVDPVFSFGDVKFTPSKAMLIGHLQVDYNSRYIYLTEGSALLLPEGPSTMVRFPLQGVLFYQWYAGDPMVNPDSLPDNYPIFTIVKTMKISNVYSPNQNETQWLPTPALSIQTDGIFDVSDPNYPNPTIKVSHSDSTGSMTSPVTLTPEAPKTDMFQLPPGTDYAGIDCKIRADFTVGCVFFDGYTDSIFHDARLIKPLNEVNPGASDYQIRFCRIFDWKGEKVAKRL